MKNLGTFIKAARKRTAITIREAEKRSGVSNAYLNQIENGRIKRPSPDILSKIGALYDLPYDVLLHKAGYTLPDFENREESDGDRRHRILIIDDDPRDRELLIERLAGFTGGPLAIREARSGAEGLALLEEEGFDCVFLDYRMPEIDGLEVLRRIRRTRPRETASIIMLTGQGNEAAAVEAIRLGAANYITKSEKKEAILAALKQSLMRTQMRRPCADAPSRRGDENEVAPNDARTLVRRIRTTLERMIEDDHGARTGDLRLLLREVDAVEASLSPDERPLRGGA
ncbi:MAG TPA: response regulator [Spirochaetota bacterium]|nr:response regulator [Spirochaetota bacterium]HNT13004.1 response regulator [Spirochaetota bacterium]